MFNPIIDEPLTHWRGVPIKTSYKQVIKYYALLNETDIPIEKKAELILNLFFDRLPPDCEEIWELIQFFINRGEETDNDDDNNEKIFDFDLDSGRLYSAFYQVYKIDLHSSDFHWWYFYDLFLNLPDNTKLMQVMDIRGKKPIKENGVEYNRKLNELKNYYSLEKPEEKIKKQKKSMSSFFGGW